MTHISLLDLPADVFTEVVSELHVADILRLRRVCTKLSAYTRLRNIWYTSLTQACTSYGVPRHASQFQSFDNDQLEQIATSPEKFQAALNSLADEPDGALLSNTCRFRPPIESRLPDTDCIQAQLVTGGRWLVTLSDGGVLKVWDLQPPWALSGEGASQHPQHVLRVEHWDQDTITQLLDAYTSYDGRELVIFAQSAILNPIVKVLSLDLSVVETRSEALRLVQVSSWGNPEWVGEPTGSVAFGHDLAVFTGHRVDDPTWVWNWRSNVSKRVKLHPPTATDNLFRTKVVAGHLIAVHGMARRKCTLSVYGLDLVGLDPISTPQDLDDEAMQLADSGSGQDDAGEEVPLAPEFTTKFHGLHHVEAFRPAARSGQEDVPPSGTSSSSRTAHFTDRRSSTYSVPFHVQDVAISQPYWLIAPSKAKSAWDRERGAFRIAVAFESTSEASVRSRLQYHIRVDLNATDGSRMTIDGLTRSQASSGTGTGGATTAAASNVPYPRLRGRVSAIREIGYTPGGLHVGLGKQTIVSLWSGSDGIHAHTSGVTKRERSTSLPAAAPAPTPKRQAFGPVVTIRPRMRRPGSSGTVPVLREPVAMKTVQTTSYDALGSDVVVYPWMPSRLPKDDDTQFGTLLRLMGSEAAAYRPGDLAFKPMADLMALYGGGGSGSGAETMKSRVGVTMDVFSGRIIAVDEMVDSDDRHQGSVVRILAYV